MILDDFVMLGTTVPEPNSDGRVFVCSAGYSAELRSLVRIYPLARRAVPHRWDMFQVPVERNPQDSRLESFKVRGDRSPEAHIWINSQFTPAGTVAEKDRATLLQRCIVGSITEANERRLSLAIIHPHSAAVHFEHNPQSPASPQLSLFDDDPRQATTGARRFPHLPRLRFFDERGPHDLMLRDWGVYELMRKRDTAYFQENMATALHLTPSSSLLVGNMNNQRTAWLVIAVLNGLQKPVRPSIFDAPEDAAPVLAEVRG